MMLHGHFANAEENLRKRHLWKWFWNYYICKSLLWVLLGKCYGRLGNRKKVRLTFEIFWFAQLISESLLFLNPNFQISYLYAFWTDSPPFFFLEMGVGQCLSRWLGLVGIKLMLKERREKACKRKDRKLPRKQILIGSKPNLLNLWI